jgi:hypothetical protein
MADVIVSSWGMLCLVLGFHRQCHVDLDVHSRVICLINVRVGVPIMANIGSTAGMS